MRPLVVCSWVLAAIVVLLWIPPLGRIKVAPALEMAFYYGALFLPMAGALFALQPAIGGPSRAAPIAALVVHILLAAAYLLLVGTPVS